MRDVTSFMTALLVANHLVISFSRTFLLIFMIRLSWNVKWVVVGAMKVHYNWSLELINFGGLLAIWSRWENFTPQINPQYYPLYNGDHLNKCIYLKTVSHLLKWTSYSVWHIPTNNQNTHLRGTHKWLLTVITTGIMNWMFNLTLGLWAT